MSENTNNSTKIGRERPLSPHLQVYKPQFTSFLSIMHRASIVVMYFASLAFVYFLYQQAFPFECPCVNWFLSDETGKLVGKLLLSGVALAASYWVCATIRHLFWDMGKGFDIKTAWLTAKISVLSTLVLAGVIIFYGIW